MFLSKQINKNLIVLFLLLIFSLPAIFALFNSGFLITDDGDWMAIRFSAFYSALRDGQFPVRFLAQLNYGYGYPVSNFLYPGFMYLAVPIHALGFDLLQTIKIMFGFSMVSSGVFMFFWLSKLFKKEAAFFGALFYIYAPYHLYDLYVRGSLGELLALVIVPFLLWQIERRSFIFTTFGIAGLMLSHNTLAVLFLPVIILYMLLDIVTAARKAKLTIRYFAILLLGFFLSAFFSIPAIFELQHTVFSQTVISDFQKYFADYNLVGIPTFLIFSIAIGIFITGKKNISKHRLTILFLITGILSVFLTLSFSLQLWKLLPVSFVQFPYRFLSITILCSAFLCASVLSSLPKRNAIGAGILLILSTVLLSNQYMIPKGFSSQPNSFYSTNEATTTVLDEYMPKWVQEKPSKHAENKIEIIQGESIIKNLTHNSKNIVFTSDSQTATTLRINTIYYPGWEAQLNGKNIKIDYSNKFGVMDIDIPAGKNQLKLKFEETPLRFFADLLSLGGLLILGALSVIRIKNKALL
jgi:hypothetical protein